MSGQKGGFERQERVFLLAQGRPTDTLMIRGFFRPGGCGPAGKEERGRRETQTFPLPYLRENELRGFHLFLLQASAALPPSKG